MRTAIRLPILCVSAILVAGCAGPHPQTHSAARTHEQPYSGLQERSVRALPPERVTELLEGGGAGYALAAELNHYPGPTHVLQLSSQLQLTAIQRGSIEAIFTAMRSEAQILGRQLVDLETDLDRGFRGQSLTPSDLEALTDRIADVEGQLRNVHLQAHLQTKDVLTAEQVRLYDGLRGYLER